MPEQYVFADRNRQRVGPLEHHADLFAHLHQLHVRGIDVLAHDIDAAGDADVAQAFVDPVDAAQKGALAAAGGTDHRGDDALLDVRSTSNSAWKVPYQRFSFCVLMASLRFAGGGCVAVISRTSLPRSPGCAGPDLAGEQVFGHADLDASSVQEKRRTVGQPAGLLHQVGHQDDRDFLRSSFSTSSMRIVVTGSTAIENSSSISNSGSWDSARAIVRRCCWPPDSMLPSESSRSLTSSHSAARRRQRSTMTSSSALFFCPQARRQRHVVVDRQRQADRQRKDHADPPAQAIDVANLADVHAVERDLPSTVMSGLNMSMRLIAFRNEVLPALAGPMMPKISCSWMSKLTPSSAVSP